MQAIAEIALAPLLVGVSSWVSHRWGERHGGIASAFPAIVGPFLLIAATRHGERFAAQAASATLTGLVGLSAFAAVYGRSAVRRGWSTSLAAGWTAAGALSLLVAAAPLAAPVGLLAAVGSLMLARRSLPSVPSAAHLPLPGGGRTALRMLATTLLVGTLALAADHLGSLVAGLLAALPALASILVVFTHRESGAAAVVRLLDGMLAGMAGFVLFCETVALLIVPAGVPVAFVSATLAAIVAQWLIASSAQTQPASPRASRRAQREGRTPPGPPGGRARRSRIGPRARSSSTG